MPLSQQFTQFNAIHSVFLYLNAVYGNVFSVKSPERHYFLNSMTLTLLVFQFNAVNNTMFSIQRRYSRFFPDKCHYL